MFYGGRLLSGLSATDPEVDDFISLRRINRWMIVVMDSDRSRKYQALNDTKIRIQKEYQRADTPGHAWVTDGREIENYIPHVILETSVKEIYGKEILLPHYNKYGQPLPKRLKDGQRIDKIKVAREVAAITAAVPEILDLRLELKRLVSFVRDANAHSR